MTIPASSPVLPESCILISYDAEANRSPPDKSFVPGSTISIGLVAYLWPEGVLVRLPYSKNTLHMAIKPLVETDDSAAEFWRQHPHAARCTGLYAPVFSAERQRHDLKAYFTRLIKMGREEQYVPGTDRPLALLAQPHSYDCQHLLAVADNCGFTELREWASSWHNVADVLAKRYPQEGKWAKDQFSKRLRLPHIADQDAEQQALAFFSMYKHEKRLT